MSQNNITQLNSFEIVYGKNPSRVLKLMHVPYIEWLSIKANNITDYLYGIQEQVKKIITDINAKYKAITNTHHMRVMFEVSDLYSSTYSWQGSSGRVQQADINEGRTLWGVVKDKCL